MRTTLSPMHEITGDGHRTITYIWQVELDPVNAPGVFADIVDEASGNPATAVGRDLYGACRSRGLALRVKAVYEDAHGVLETAFSNATGPVAPGAPAPATPAPGQETIVDSPNGGIHLIKADVQFILDQILLAEQRPDGNVLDLIANPRLPFGLRTVDGTFNNLVRDQTEFGSADRDFPLLLKQMFRNEADGETFDTNGPQAPGGMVDNTNYAITGNVVDGDPRIISNLIVDQTANNPAAIAAALRGAGSEDIPGDTAAFLEALQTLKDAESQSTANLAALLAALTAAQALAATAQSEATCCTDSFRCGRRG